MKNKLNYINLGCGSHYHKDWVNVDFISNNQNVIACNLLNGIPFPDNSFEVVYHSAVLEHFPKEKAGSFIKECYRVLKPNGIIRIAVPDLRSVVIEYLNQLKRCENNEMNAHYDYEWIMLELFDQTVRNKSGGSMAEFLFCDHLINEEFVFNRIGNEGKLLRKQYFASKNKTSPIAPKLTLKTKIKNQFKKYLIEYLYKEDVNTIDNYIQIGKFRSSGEIHQWMYDSYSLSNLLNETGFRSIESKTAYESNIPKFKTFELDVLDGEVRKPDSFYMEAFK